MEFLNRTEEKSRLSRFLKDQTASFACLYGRRRCGKSRLLQETVARVSRAVYHVADLGEPTLQRARLAADISTILQGFDRVSYPDWGALLDRWCADAPKGSVLILDEFPYLAERSPELPSILQRIIDRLTGSDRKIVICGSSQRMMHGLVLDASEPLYGRAREILNVKPLSFPWTEKAFPALSALERLELYSVWGGVPRYWELQCGYPNLRSALRDLLFSPQGILREEPRRLLLDDLSDLAQAASVLSLIGNGARRASEIASRLGIAATALSRPIRRLQDLGLVAKDIPFGCEEKDNKRSFYRVADPFLSFWYRFVQPNLSDSSFLQTEEDYRIFHEDFRIRLGEHWEQLVRESLPGCPFPSSPLRWKNVRRWWGTGTNRAPMEIDVVAESRDGSTLLVGEAKLSLTRTEARHVRAELAAKAEQLPFAKQYKTIVPVLFVAEKAPDPDCVTLDWLSLSKTQD